MNRPNFLNAENYNYYDLEEETERFARVIAQHEDNELNPNGLFIQIDYI
jgi:hypothetical protein